MVSVTALKHGSNCKAAKGVPTGKKFVIAQKSGGGRKTVKRAPEGWG